MPARDWSNIGSVTVRVASGTQHEFSDLTEAVSWVGLSNVERLSKGHLGYYLVERYYHGSPCTGGDEFLFIDELGLVIPPWKVIEHARSLPTETWVWRRRGARNRKGLYRYRCGPYDPEKHFRNGPVHGIHNYGSRRYHGIRRIATSAEIAANELLNYDEEAQEYGVLARPNRRRGNLATSWDDIRPARQGNGWKSYRKTRYKVKKYG